MSKKGDAFYFENFVACADCACRAAQMLKEVLDQFDPDQLPDQIDQLHKIEHEGDTHHHQMLETLASSFITPIEREDIMALSRNLDRVTDTIEDSLLRIYMCNVQELREEAHQFAQTIVQSCGQLKKIMEEFSEFKKSKQIKSLIIEVNQLEEVGDRLFLTANRNLYTSCNDPLQVIAWRDVFNYLERCLDACEDTADIVEMVIMKNT